MEILSYHVFNGRKWLADDEKTWTDDFHGSASFTDPKLAQDVGAREQPAHFGAIYVLACVGWL